MKIGMLTSATSHAAILMWGLLSFSAPTLKEINLNNVEFDLQFDEQNQPVRGEKEGEVSNETIPQPTKKIEPAVEAENVGDSANDDKSLKADRSDSKAVEKSVTAPDPDKLAAIPKPAPKSEPSEAVTATKTKNEQQPAIPVTQEADETPQQNTEAEQQLASLPEAIPVPVSKPKAPKARSAKTTQPKKQTKPPAPKRADAKKDPLESIGDLIQNNRTTEDRSAGGKKSSSKVAKLGDRNAKNFGKLSNSDEAELISRIGKCSTGPGGRDISDDLRITVTMFLNKDGSLVAVPKGKASGGTADEQRKYSRDVIRFVRRCAPYDFLKQEEFEVWSEIAVTFHPSQMFE